MIEQNPAREERAPTQPLGSGEDACVEAFTWLRPGHVFAGRYEVLGVLGCGGTGQVFRAHDRVAGCKAALKILFPRGGGQGHALERLRRELRILRELHHPGIVRVHDLGFEGGLLYLAMELLEGETLHDRIRDRGKLDRAEALRVLRGVLQAVSAAHRAGVVHRDIKPQNVFLTRDEPPRVVVLDFGLARKQGEATLTATEGVLGTPEYCAPEQARGEVPVGAAADVYSIGVVLWEMLSGAPPFRGHSPLATLEAQTRQPLPSPRAHLGAVPGWLRDLVAWMLDKSPQLRPASAEEVVAVLDGARRVPRPRRWRRWFGRDHPSGGPRARAIAVGVVATALLLAGAAALAWRAPGRVVANDRAVEVSNVFGESRHVVRLPRRVADVMPADPEAAWPRSHLVQLGGPTGSRKAFPPEYPVGLARLDTWTGALEPFVFEPAQRWENGLFQAREGFDAVFRGTGLAQTPWHGEAGRPVLLAIYRHEKHYPTQLLFFEGTGRLRSWVDHPGTVREPYVDVPGDRSEDALMAFTAQNNRLGQRRVVFAVKGPELQVGRAVTVPPEREAGAAAPAFYTFLSVPSTAAGAIARQGDRLVFTASEGIRVPLDARTGVPQAAAHRGGQSPSGWLRSQHELIGLLERAHRATRARGRAELEQVAAALSDYASEQFGRSRAQRGVALARSAELFRWAGETSRAAGLVERALEIEPTIPGHHRLLVDLLRREGRWPEARERVLAADSDALLMPEVLRDLFIAALIEGDTETARRLVLETRGFHPIPLTYGRYCRALLELHEGRPAEALSVLEEDAYLASLPGFAFLRALALSQLPEPRPSAARRALSVAEEGRGGGHVLPFAPLRARLAALDGGLAPTPAELQAALERQRWAARGDPVARYFLDWAERLAR